MIKTFEHRQTGGILRLQKREPVLAGRAFSRQNDQRLHTIAFNPCKPQQVFIGDVAYVLPPNSILPLVADQDFRFEQPEQVIAWQFNREFYCLADHDARVGSAGFLFYGVNHPRFIRLNELEIHKISSIQRLFEDDITCKDGMQGEMLRTTLKRLIICVTRIAKRQWNSAQISGVDNLDIIRQFNILVETHFAREHAVKFYAAALNKAPKTLSNIFAGFNRPSPSSLIKDRIIMEAKRYAHHSGKSAKEIAFLLGFEDAAHFSHFFKNNTGMSFTDFKKRQVLVDFPAKDNIITLPA